MAKKAKKAKVTSFAEFRKKVEPGAPTCSMEQFLGMLKPLNPLGVTSDQDILDKMKASGDPTLAAFAKDLERQMKGEDVDLRKYSDI